MRKICLILIIVLSISNAQAQKLIGLGDTIVVYIDNRVEVKLSVADYSTFSENHEAYKILLDFQELLPEITDRLDPEIPEKVTIMARTDWKLKLLIPSINSSLIVMK